MPIVLCLFLYLMPLQSTKVLVLKNGKKITCQSFELKGDMVKVRRKKDTFSIPKKAIDWEKSKQMTRKYEALQQKKQAAKAEKIAQEDPDYWLKKPKDPISLTNEEYQKIATVYLVDEEIITYSKMGNSILVNATINNRGTFQFILDTGAAITVISPEAANSSGAKYTDEKIRLVGVGGQAAAKACILDSIGMGNAQVSNFKAVVKRIPTLNNQNIVGLLGQDYLNYFVMNLDPSNNKLTLKPHDSSAGKSARIDVKSNHKKGLRLFREIKEIHTKMLAMYNDFQGEKDLVKAEDLGLLMGKLRTAKSDLSNLEKAFSKVPKETLKKMELSNLTPCYKKHELLVAKLIDFGHLLREAYQTTKNLDKLDPARISINPAIKDVEDCF